MNRQERRRKEREGPGRDPFRMVAGALAVGFAVVALVLVGRFSSDPTPEDPHADHTHDAVRPLAEFSPETLAVASRFVCTCSSCDEPELAECVCPTAIEEKEMIQRELDAGHKAAHVIEMVQTRYGGFKGEKPI